MNGRNKAVTQGARCLFKQLTDTGQAAPKSAPVPAAPTVVKRPTCSLAFTFMGLSPKRMAGDAVKHFR